MILFQNQGLTVRTLEDKDDILLAKWLSDPSVLEFYEGRDNPFDLNKVREVFYDENNEEVKCIVEYKGNEIGYIQYYPLEAEEKKEYGYCGQNVYGTDQFIGETTYWNKGMGTLLVTSMIEFLLVQQKADRVVMDPQTRNERAIHCYEKCGFKKVRLLPKQELHEGIYQDCWLMEYDKKQMIF